MTKRTRSPRGSTLPTFIQDETADRILRLAENFCEWYASLDDDAPVPCLKSLGDTLGYADVSDPFMVATHLRLYLPGLHAMYKQRCLVARQVCRSKVHALASERAYGSLKTAYEVGAQYGVGHDRVREWYHEVAPPLKPRYAWGDVTQQLKRLLKQTPPLAGAGSVRELCPLLESTSPISQDSFYSWMRRSDNPIADKVFAALKKNRGTR